jgi:hypothetical protein
MVMKKIIGVTVALCFALGFVSCGSSPKTANTTTTTTTTTPAAASKPERRIGGNVPDFVKDAIKKAPEDALIGIGSAKLSTQSQSRTIATTRARAEISRQMNTMIQDMIRDYQASSEADPKAALSFQENITVALSKSTLTGSRVTDFDYTDDGTCWVVVLLDKSSAVQEINQAQAAARLAVPAMASFNAEDRMNAAFDRVYGSELGIGDR